jgi:glycosyltransferase involved in cell wall biosynthesis
MSAESAAAASLRLAYLVSRYPAVTHTFVSDEIRALREAGAEIHTFSVRRAAPEEILSEHDAGEFAATQWLVPAAPLSLVDAHLRALAGAPAAYAATLAHALRHRPRGARAALWQFFYFAEAIMLWRGLEERGLRHVHVHFPNVASDVAMLATGYANRRARTAEARWTWSMTLHGPTEFFDVDAHRLAEKVADAAAVICIGDFTRSQVMACTDPSDWDRLQVVPCGVDVAAFVPVPAPARGRLEVLNVAAMSPRKAQAVLLEAVALLRDRGVAVGLTLVGEGPERGRLQDMARRLGVADVTTFTGALGHDRVRDRYAMADAFCLPSLAEGVPIVLMEAMACGLPVVASAVAGIPELVKDRSSGLLIAPGRADLLADALHALAEDEPLRVRLGRAGREQILAARDLRRCAGELARVLARSGAGG